MSESAQRRANRPAFLWIPEFGVLHFRLMVKRGPSICRLPMKTPRLSNSFRGDCLRLQR
jgi:hypothetical protein